MLASNASLVVTDCFGSTYHRIRITGNGLCGFNSLSYCLTASEQSFQSILDDCVNVFKHVPELFYHRTNYGANCQGLRTVDDYERFMRQTIQRVIAGELLPFSQDNEFWCEDGHLSAISLLYDICIFIYSSPSRVWFAFNEAGRKGYICLYNSNDHIEVLHGVSDNLTHQIPPIIPRQVTTQAVNRQSALWTETLSRFQKPYAYSHVWHWPTDFTRVQIPNSSLFQSQHTQRSCHSSPFKNRLQFLCDSPSCSYAAKSKSALRLHILRKHHSAKGVEDVVTRLTITSVIDDSNAVAPKRLKGSSNCFHEKSNICQEQTPPTLNIKVAATRDVQENANAERISNLHLPEACYSECHAVHSENQPLSEASTMSSLANRNPDSALVNKQQCLNCGNFYINLANHKKCSHKFSRQLQITGSVNDEPRFHLEPTSASSDVQLINANILNSNISRAVSSNRHWKCPHCDQTFKSSPALKLHQRSSTKCRMIRSLCDPTELSGDLAVGHRDVADSVTFTDTVTEPSVSTTKHKQMCSKCRLYFVNLANHVKCRGSMKSVSDSTTIDNKTGVTVTLPLTHPSKKPTTLTDKQKQPCPKCGILFVDLTKHLKCKAVNKSTESNHNQNISTLVEHSASVAGNFSLHEVNNVLTTGVITRSSKRRKLADEPTLTQLPNSGDGQNNPTIPLVSADLNSNLKHDIHVAFPTSCQEDVTKDVLISRKQITAKMNNQLLTTHVKGSSRKIFAKSYLKAAVDQLHKRFKIPSDITTDCPFHAKLKEYHDKQQGLLSSVATMKITPEIAEVVENVKLIDLDARQHQWSEDEKARLKSLTDQAKLLKPPPWPWGAPEDSEQGKYNHARMKLWADKQCSAKLLKCPECGVTVILVGVEQDNYALCPDCIALNKLKTSVRTELQDTWKRVRPNDKRPKCVTPGYEDTDLPELMPGDQAVIALIHPVVTVRRNQQGATELKEESIHLLQNPKNMWAKFLPRVNLFDRFVIIERKNDPKPSKYVVTDVLRVRLWLDFLFRHHKHYVEYQRLNLLNYSLQGLNQLQTGEELAAVLHPSSTDEIDDDDNNLMQSSPSSEIRDNQNVPQQYAVDANLSRTDLFAYDKYPFLYLKAQHKLRLEKANIRIIHADENDWRKPTYNADIQYSCAFPHLYPHGETAPLDVRKHTLARKILKKLHLFAEQANDGKLRWNFAEDSVHMMHSFARLTEMNLNATVGWYISARPDTADIPVQQLIDAFKHGADQQGLIESRLPDLQGIMSKIRNSREHWFAERLAVETMVQKEGQPNVFLTLNMDPRAWPDVRKVICDLENAGLTQPTFTDEFVKDNKQFTELLEKHAVQISIYLSRKAKSFIDAFAGDICRVNKTVDKQVKPVQRSLDNLFDDKPKDRYKDGWHWERVEFTKARGIQHWHCLLKLPYVLSTSILARAVYNGRIIREELKCHNIKNGCEQRAWQLIEIGLLADRYLRLFSDSVSTAAFFSQPIDTDQFDSTKVIDESIIRREFRKQYFDGNVTTITHPIMRSYSHPACDTNTHVERANVGAISCIHECILQSCGGDPVTGSGCRFGYPRTNLKYTVVAVLKVNSQQVEVQVLPRRTAARASNMNRYLLQYWRANHDATVLVDISHIMRYVTKYVSKPASMESVFEEVIDNLERRSNNLFPPTTKQALSHLLLASCSHKAFFTKQELAYRVMDLPLVRSTFPSVAVIGFYNRASLVEKFENETGEKMVQFSDRTEYSAYSERCDQKTQFRGFDQNEIDNIGQLNFDNFVEKIRHRWIQERQQMIDIDPHSTHMKLKTRVKENGHWLLIKRSTPRSFRWSTVLYTIPTHLYESVDPADTTTQTLFHSLPEQKKQQLYRAYYELVVYVPWKNTPDETFLPQEDRDDLSNPENDPEANSRYSLRRLEAFHRQYMHMYNAGLVAKEGTKWHQDNQMSQSMYESDIHNSDIRLERVENKGMMTPRYDMADELEGTQVQISAKICDPDVDDIDLPSVQSFLPADTLREIQEQEPVNRNDIHVAFPLSYEWQKMEELVTKTRNQPFLARPPPPSVSFENLSPYQQKAITLIETRRCSILYITGKAGSGKTEIAKHMCQKFEHRVQAGAATGKAAINYNGTTVHTMFGWSHKTKSVHDIKPATLDSLRNLYKDVELFIIDEVNALPASSLALIDEVMNHLFSPRDSRDAIIQTPFGGKKIVFLGDGAQLPPVNGAAIYDDSIGSSKAWKRRRSTRRNAGTIYEATTLRGISLYRNYLLPNVIMLKTGKRNTGLLQDIMDRIRDGKQTDDDQIKLQFQATRFPNARTHYGVHYTNEMCSFYNYVELWQECKRQEPHTYMHVCRAVYYETDNNDFVREALAKVAPNKFGYAPDVLCVTEGTQVHLLRNINVSAGLVNSAVGRIVRVVYNNADVQALLDARCPPPYSLIVDFEDFTGFPVKDSTNRYFPFPAHRKWVPLFKTDFFMEKPPKNIIEKQTAGYCWRRQFPVDLNRHVTAHKGQGQTWRNCLVAIDLGVDAVSSHIPADLTSLFYVGCTRVTKLENLFVSSIHPNIWKQLGNSEQDVKRRLHETKLEAAARSFAQKHRFLAEYQNEIRPQSHDHTKEWDNLVNAANEPTFNNISPDCRIISTTTSDPYHEFVMNQVDCNDDDIPIVFKPVTRERHIGIDQGIKNFAMVAVDCINGEKPRVVGCEKYNLSTYQPNLRLHSANAAEVIIVLNQHTVLLNWMQKSGTNFILQEVDRVVVHIEQIAKTNPYNKSMGIGLGQELQKLVDPKRCIVKMSAPRIHSSRGPMFSLGQDIISRCQLKASPYGQYNTLQTEDANPSTSTEDTSNEDRDTEDENLQTMRPASSSVKWQQYRQRKLMSKRLFLYLMTELPNLPQSDITIDIDAQLQSRWMQQTEVHKFDDLGDALLHALSDPLCGTAGHRQLVPSVSTLHDNRTIVIKVERNQMHFIVIHCSWNVITIEDMAFSPMNLSEQTNYKTCSSTVADILQQRLGDLVANFEQFNNYLPTEVIKIITKQLKSYRSQQSFTSKMAGALTDSTFLATALLVEKIAKDRKSSLARSVFHDSKSGETQVLCLDSGRKYHLNRSGSKHTNALMSCMDWLKKTGYSKKQTLHLTAKEKLDFFLKLRSIATNPPDIHGYHQMEQIRIADGAIDRFLSPLLTIDSQTTLADLLLIGISKNMPHVQAIAKNYRRTPTSQLQSTVAEQSSV